MVRSVLLALALSFGLVMSLWRLGVPTLTTDEVIYRAAGLEYVHGDLTENQQHPFLAKYLIGIAQELLGTDRLAVARLPSALAGFATGLLLLLFARRVAGYWAGLLCFALWIALPHSINSGFGVPQVKIERLALLDPLMVCLMVAALYAGWRWIESTQWRWALLAGTAAGLAAAAKPPGVLVLPGIVLCGVLVPLVRNTSWRTFGKSAAQSAATGMAATAAAIATYAPLGARTPEAIRFMFAFQAEHGRSGHSMLVAGRLYEHPPWWSHLWWQSWNYGLAATISICAAICVCLFLRPRSTHVPFFAYTALGMVVPLVFLSFLVGFKLPTYYFAWQAPLTLLVGVAIHALLAIRGWRLAVGLGLLAPLAWLGAHTVADVARLRPADYSAAAELLRTHHATDGNVVVYGYANVLRNYLPDTPLLHNYTTRDGPVTAIIDDPVATGRVSERTRALQRTAIGRLLRQHATHYRVDHLDVYVAPAAVSRSSR